MSYDISILSRTPNSSVNKAQLKRYLVGLGLFSDSENHFLFRESGVNYADMDLAWAENDSYSEPADEVNCLQIHVPYSYLESKHSEVLRQCQQIAAYLDWKIYDEQEGKYLR